MPSNSQIIKFIPETRFGNWFINTNIWKRFVLREALKSLRKQLRYKFKKNPTVLDVGCGYGNSFSIIRSIFHPEKIIGIDVHNEALEHARNALYKEKINGEILYADCAHIPLADNSIDVITCHQTLHHVLNQEKAMAEFYRVLRPGGILLFAESTKIYIHSWIVRLLFNHPNEVQKSAAEYLDLVKNAGFSVQTGDATYPDLWWSRTLDFGLLELIGINHKQKKGKETLIQVTALKEN
jgi:ubiquinone/menaquinone biosynthesis C-methylase UbiE